MDCREAILSDEYIDFVWKMDVRPPEAEWLPYGYCGQYISPNISVYYDGGRKYSVTGSVCLWEIMV